MDHVFHELETPAAPRRSRDTLILEELGLAPSRRELTPGQLERYERNLAEILAALGLDLDTRATHDTPRRLLAALVEATDGYEGDPKLITAFPTECHGGASCELAQIVEGPIPFHALCEHHALPFFGRAWLGYVAHEQILGISKLTRLVRVLTRRFGVQERMTHQIADTLEPLTQAHGVAVYLEAEHLCMQHARRARARVADPDDRLSRRLRAGPEPARGIPGHRRHRAWSAHDGRGRPF